MFYLDIACWYTKTVTRNSSIEWDLLCVTLEIVNTSVSIMVNYASKSMTTTLSIVLLELYSHSLLLVVYQVIFNNNNNLGYIRRINIISLWNKYLIPVIHFHFKPKYSICASSSSWTEINLKLLPMVGKRSVNTKLLDQKFSSRAGTDYTFNK